MSTAGVAIAITTSLATVIALLIGWGLATCACCCRGCKAAPNGACGGLGNTLAALFALAVFTLTVAGTFTNMAVDNNIAGTDVSITFGTVKFCITGTGGQCTNTVGTGNYIPVFNSSANAWSELMAGLSFLIIAFIFQFFTMIISLIKVCKPTVRGGSLTWSFAIFSAICMTLGVTMAVDASYQGNITLQALLYISSAGLSGFVNPAAGPGTILLLIALGLEYIHIWIQALTPAAGAQAPKAAGGVVYDAAVPAPVVAAEPPAAVVVSPPEGEALPAHVAAAAAFK